MIHQHAALGDTVYFWFASNDTGGSGNDGASAAADVRLAGAAASAAPVLSPTPSLLSHASFPAGCYEVAVDCTTGNGFADGGTYAVFSTIAVDSQNPVGFVGSVTLTAVATASQVDGVATDAATARKALTNKRVLDPSTGTETLYDDDGSSLYTRTVYEDKDAAQTYQGTGADRVEKYT